MIPHLFNRRYFSAWTQSNNTADSATAIEIPIHKQCRLLVAVGVGHLRQKQRQPEKIEKIKTKYHWQQLYWSQSFGHKTETGQQRVNRIKYKVSNRQQLSNSINSEQRIKKKQSTIFYHKLASIFDSSDRLHHEHLFYVFLLVGLPRSNSWFYK